MAQADTASFFQRYLPKRIRAVFVFTILYIVAFSIGFYIGGDYEFVIYTVMMLAATVLIPIIIRDLEIPVSLLWMLSFAGVLHMLGGGVHVDGQRLYSYIIYPFYMSPTDPGLQIFRFDQFVHLFGYAVIALCIHYVLRRYNPNADPVFIALLTIFATMGIGSLNEIVEFLATLSLPSTGVGDYSNTLLDLISNTLGAIIAVAGFETVFRLKK